MRVSLIVAMAENRVIGRDNQLPWQLSADLKHFKALTMGKPVIMGRKTWESIGKPLPGRANIVITRDPGYHADGCTVVNSVEQALQAAGDSEEVMVIGGAELYRQMLASAQRLYITLVRAEVAGDTLFPEVKMTEWREVARESHRADEKNDYDYEFLVYERKP